MNTIEPPLYSERNAPKNTLHHEVPRTLKNAISYLVVTPPLSTAAPHFRTSVMSNCSLLFGEQLDKTRFPGFVESLGLLEFLDLLEIIAREGKIKYNYTLGGGYWSADQSREALPEADRFLNNLMARHSFGYKLRKGQIIPIASPALSEIVVEPALFASRKLGWEATEDELNKALQALRSNQVRETISHTCAALECALRAAGCKGKTLKMLVVDGQDHVFDLYPSVVLERLMPLLTVVEAWRSQEGIAHGRDDSKEVASRSLAVLSLHWASSIIVFLHDVKTTRSA